MSLYAKATGDPSAPAVVFLHGVGNATVRAWIEDAPLPTGLVPPDPRSGRG